MFKQLYYWFPITVLLMFINACAPLNVQESELDPSSEEGKQYTIESTYSDFETMLTKAGCQSFQSYVWNYIYKIVSTEKGKPPPYYTVKEKITQRIQKLMKNHSAPKEAIQNFARRFVEIYALVTEFMDQYQEEEATNTLVQLEHGIAEQSHIDFTDKLKKTFLELNKSAKILNKNCQEENESYVLRKDNRSTDSSMQEWNIRWFYTMRKNLHPLVYGARKVMSTAYQSCSVLDLPLMPIGHNTKGIYVVSRHQSGKGLLRAVSNLNAIRQSHYYLSQTPIPANQQCLNIYNYPLIYDYGGKPSTALHSINLFKNSGSGAKFLGVDCSGFVASAMASSGLRLKPGVFIRPIHVKGMSSWMFKNAHRYNLSCLQQQDISPNNPIRPGDIIASNSHIFIVDSVGMDPFNLLPVSNSSECHSQSIKFRHFKFSIIQSSAHNNGVGINRMHIRDAVDGLNTMNRGLKRTASRACYKMFGKDTHKNINEIAILRHASNEPACRDREIYLENQECLKSCKPRYIH